jgi:polyhydroxyalkanoate synthesis regulator phasin
VKTKNGGRSKESTRDVYLETPENMATMQEVVALTKDVKRLRDKIEKLKATLKTVPVEGAKQ